MSDPEETSGPGHTLVNAPAIIVIVLLSVALGLLTLYSLWAFWPLAVTAGGAQKPQRVSYFGTHINVNREFLFFLTVALSGALGGLIHNMRSFVWYVGNRSLIWSWIPYYLLLPVVGALAGTVFYLVLRAGLFSPSTSVEQASPFGFAAIAILAGLFSPQAFEKLRLIAGDIFAKGPEGKDHVEPQHPDGAQGTGQNPGQRRT